MNIAKKVFSNPLTLPAFIRGDDTPITYGQVGYQVKRVLEGLGKIGLSSTARVAWITPRGPTGLIGFLAISSAAVCCPLDSKLRDEELLDILKDLSIDIIIDATETGRFRTLATRAKIHFYEFSALLSGETLPGENGCNGSFGSSSGDDVALVLQTTGTTSKPKHVALTHNNIIAASEAIGGFYKIGPDDVCYCPMPHHHVHGLISAGLSSLIAGAAQYCASSFSSIEFETVCARLQPTWFTGSPAFHLGLIDHFTRKGGAPTNPRLRFARSSSAPFPAPAAEKFETVFGIPLLENYGMTETASTICSNPLPPDKRKIGSVGRPIGSAIRILDNTHKECLPNQEGEVVVRGPSTIGSYASGETGLAHFLDGWLRTGDVGRFDEEGYLYILGRTKELIKRGGHSVYPLEVDSALAAHPEIVEAMSFSIEHPTLGEDLAAVFVARQDAGLDGQEVRAFLERSLSTYKIPSAIFRVTTIPKNATGKTPRRLLRDVFSDMLKNANEPPENQLEDKIIGIWRTLLDRDDLGATDNVLLSGGDPLRAQTFVEILQKSTGHVLALKEILANPTPRLQAKLVLCLSEA